MEIIKKAAEQKRHVMLIGEPGTGKSMLAKSMTEYLPKGELQDVIAYHNPEDPNEPQDPDRPGRKGQGDRHRAEEGGDAAQEAAEASMVTVIVFMVVLV